MSDLCGLGVQRKGRRIHMRGFSGRSVLEEDHVENPITRSAPIFMLGSSKRGYCHPCLPAITPCLPKVQLQSPENNFFPLSELIVCIFLLSTLFVINLTLK